mmetsp:Transcript_84573/g.148335  ORF Transcript_84573/g.148335 Transcript_84573/m.148335 type:complete len:98 (-) Transcript_84573:565-858(-)
MMPLVSVQQSHIRQQILKEREYGLTVSLDESRDPISETELVNVIIVTANACNFVDTFFVPDEKADTDKYGDSFGKAFVQWWDTFFIPHEAPDAPPPS